MDSNSPNMECLRTQATASLQEYRLAHGRDTLHGVLEAALEHLPHNGRINLMRDVIEIGGQADKIRQLATFFTEAILKPMYLKRTEPSVTPSPSSGADSEVNDSVENLTSSPRSKQLKERCLRRDGYRCIASRVLDASSAVTGLVPTGKRERSEACSTICGHVIPFGIRSIELDKPREKENKAAVWYALWRYFPDLRGLISPETINRPENAMTLAVTLHDHFDKFIWSLEPAPGQADTYHVRYFADIEFPSVPHTLVLRSHEPTVPLPHHEFLRTHFIVASILHVSGLGEQMYALLNAEFWEDAHGATKADGSTDLAGLVEKRMLISL